MSSRFGFHTNHFGISEEELEYDENDPSWCITSPGANVLHGRYESAKPFIEKIQRQERAFLEEKLEERRELRQIIREKVSHEFDKKLKQHMAEFQPKPCEPLVLELFLSQQKRELEESFRKRLGETYLPESKSVAGSLTSVENSVPNYSTSKTDLLDESAPFTSESQLRTETSDSDSSFSFKRPPNTSSASATNMLMSPSVTVATRSLTVSTFGSPIFDRLSGLPTHIASTLPSSSYVAPIIQKQSDISLTLPSSSEKASHLTVFFPPETSKSGHATLTRTNSVSSCRSSASRSTSGPLQQIVEEEQSKFLFSKFSVLNQTNTVIEAKHNESMAYSTPKMSFITEPNKSSSVVSSGASDTRSFEDPSYQHKIYASEIAFAKNELKCTIKEKISVSTKKFAKPNDITQIVGFFSNLLSGLTVYGFNDKMINLKDDELARNWAMIHIIDTYLDLVPQDISLLKVIAAVLSSLALSSVTFSKLLYGKLFIASPLLAVNHAECVRCILSLKKRSERFAETLAAWRNHEIAIISLFIFLKTSNSNHDYGRTAGDDGLGLMWKMLAVTASEKSVFGATLITEILKQHWDAMHVLYGKQMEKLVTLIDRSVLPYWRASLREIVPNHLETNEIIKSVAENYLSILKFTVDDCLSSFRSQE
uniref:Nucleoporin GLE1 n=1 Tax=Setaria digitata TaxID=48799 RepID=A0A915Q1L4_9BILA